MSDRRWLRDAQRSLQAALERRLSATDLAAARLRVLAEAMHCVVVTLDRAGEMVEAQPIWQTFTGQPFSVARGTGFHAVIDDGPDERFANGFAAGLATKRPFSMMVRVWSMWAGQHRRCLLRIAPLVRHGYIEEWVLCLQDIEYDRWIESARLRQRRVAEESRRAETLRTLVVGLSHVINNALQGVMLNGELMARGRPEQQERLVKVAAGVDLVANVCAELATCAGLTHLRAEPCELGELVRKVEREARLRCPPLVELSVEVNSGPFPVRMHEGTMLNALLELLENAVESLPSTGGTVRLSTGAAHYTCGALEDAQPLCNVRAGKWFYVEICDDGHGIPAHVLPHVFDPLFSTKFAGRGFGLASLLGIVRRWGGLVTIQSAEGQGTRVRVLMPAPIDHLEGVLLVVHCHELEQAARLALEGHGLHVFTASSSEHALRLLHEHPDSVRAALLDLNCPLAVGLVRELRAQKPELGLVLAATTAAELRDCRELGVDVCLRKPWLDEELVRAVRQSAHTRSSASVEA